MGLVLIDVISCAKVPVLSTLYPYKHDNSPPYTPLRGYTFSVLVSLVSLNASLPTLRVENLLILFNAASFVGEVTQVNSIAVSPIHALGFPGS